MGSRGGRGRGRFGGGGFRFAKQEPFVLFPSDIELPAIDEDKIKKNTELVKLRNNLQRGLKNLPYYMEETFAYEEEETVDIESYSDTKKRGRTDQISLENSGYMTLLPGYFPLELVKGYLHKIYLLGTKRRIGRKVIWNPKRDLEKLDDLEALERKFKDEDGKKRNEGEEEEEEEVEEDEVLEDESEDDYHPNIVFDDDEDDFNPAEDGGDDDFLF